MSGFNLDDIQWHSSIGIDASIGDNKKFITKLPNTREARSLFLTAGDNLLIHKTSQALWRLSDDKKSIEPVFGSDILTEDDLKE